MEGPLSSFILSRFRGTESSSGNLGTSKKIEIKQIKLYLHINE